MQDCKSTSLVGPNFVKMQISKKLPTKCSQKKSPQMPLKEREKKNIYIRIKKISQPIFI